jgi:spore germination protein YaaH
MSEAEVEVFDADYQEAVYPSISKDYTINLVWHQVTNMSANDGLLNLLGNTKGVTTVSPTWFSVESNKGTITSLASETYVTRAHNAGVEVWALCSDFDTENVNMYELLSYTSRREKLENELIASAIKYNLDGLNIDFENITKDAGIHFIQFIRELSVKCRSNGIVLSVDNYTPGYTPQYDREEQGKVVDYVITMAYDEHTSASEESGSVSSLSYVTKAVEDMTALVPAEKNIIAIPFYTRIWEEETQDGETKISCSAYGMRQALDWVSQKGVEPVWSATDGQYYAEVSEGDKVYKVWLEEDESIEAKLKAIFEADVAGVAGWKLGLEKASVWNVIVKYVN